MWNFLYGESLTVYYLKEPDLPRDEWERMGNGAITPVEWCAHCSLPLFPCLLALRCAAGASAAFACAGVSGCGPHQSSLPCPGSPAPMTIRSMSSTRTPARKA